MGTCLNISVNLKLLKKIKSTPPPLAKKKRHTSSFRLELMNCWRLLDPKTKVFSNKANIVG